MITPTYPLENCPIGTYNRLEGKKELDDCVKCSAGYYCNELGKDKLVSKDECPARYRILKNQLTFKLLTVNSYNVLLQRNFVERPVYAFTECTQKIFY